MNNSPCKIPDNSFFPESVNQVVSLPSIAHENMSSQKERIAFHSNHQFQVRTAKFHGVYSNLPKQQSIHICWIMLVGLPRPNINKHYQTTNQRFTVYSVVVINLAKKKWYAQGAPPKIQIPPHDFPEMHFLCPCLKFWYSSGKRTCGTVESCWRRYVGGWQVGGGSNIAPVPGHNPLTNVVKVRPRNKGRILPFFTHPWGPTWIGTHPEYEPPIKECMGQFSENPLHQRNRRNKHLLMGLNVSKYVTQNLLY